MADEFRFLAPSDDVTNRDRSSLEFDVTDDGLGLLAHALNPDDDLLIDLPYDEVMDLIHENILAYTVTEPEYDIFDFFTDSELAELDAACFGMNLAEDMHLDRLVTEYMDQIDDIFAKVEKRVNIQKTDQWNWSDSARDSDAQEVL